MRQYFGTDGIRGVANTFPLVPAMITKIAQAAGMEYLRGAHRHVVVIGKDTRLSGYLIESALTSGFVSVGMDVVLVGPMPTPAVSMLTRSLRADLGVVISASHNPSHDNGIKFFGPDGYKLSDAQELAIEKRIESNLDLVAPTHIGSARRLDDATGRYIEYAKNTFPKGMRLDGLKIVVDCAHGAAYKIAPQVLWELGADILPIGTQPNGDNINHLCGATHAQAMQHAVILNQAHLGLSFDGDADRIMIADEQGHLIDGDALLALIAQKYHQDGLLRGPAVVATIMSNLGLEHYLKGQGIELYRTAVGDRYVVDMMRQKNLNVGGEQSGHIVLGDYIQTGDGLVAALQFLAILVGHNKPASMLSKPYEPFPQLLTNLRVQNPEQHLKDPLFTQLLEDMKTMLGPSGRLIVRKSGTEPCLRIMAEGQDKSALKKVTAEIKSFLKTHA